MSVKIPEWAWEFHGHRCPFMPMGYRMGRIAMREMGIPRVADHGAYVLSEMGIGHPQTCMMDGLQVATGCTYGKAMLERLNYGKVGCILYVPGKGAVRVAARAEFLAELGKAEFFSYRKKGVEPSQIPAEVAEEAIRIVLDAPEERAFKIEGLDGFAFDRPKSSWVKDKCDNCGEFVFERYLRIKDGHQLCIPCSGYKE